jgi:hypothetical protein
MKKNSWQYLLFATLLMGLYACDAVVGSGDITSETRPVKPFDQVVLMSGADVDIKKGTHHQIIVHADDNIQDYIITEINGRTLEVRTRSGTNLQNAQIRVEITLPELREVALTGSGTVAWEGTFEGDYAFLCRLSGSGRVKGTVHMPNTEIHLSGSGVVELQGSTKEVDVKLSGSGRVKLEKLLAEEVHANLTGSGTIYTFASVKLNARISGSGDIYYDGNPAVNFVDKGSGQLKKRSSEE